MTNRRAQVLASEWYGGQWTALYIISTHYGAYDRVSREDWVRAIDEVRAEVEVQKVASPGSVQSLLALERWLVQHLNAKDLTFKRGDRVIYVPRHQAGMVSSVVGQVVFVKYDHACNGRVLDPDVPYTSQGTQARDLVLEPSLKYI